VLALTLLLLLLSSPIPEGRERLSVGHSHDVIEQTDPWLRMIHSSVVKWSRSKLFTNILATKNKTLAKG